MRSGELAEKLNLSRDTINRWAKMPEFEKFLSPDALGDGKAHRTFTTNDILIFNTINYLIREEKVKGWDNIAARLDEGFLYEVFPDNLLDEDEVHHVPRSQAKLSAQAAALVVDRDKAYQLVDAFTNEIRDLKGKIEELEATREESTQLIMSLKEEIAELKTELKNKDEIKELEVKLARLEKRSFFDRFRKSE